MSTEDTTDLFADASRAARHKNHLTGEEIRGKRTWSHAFRLSIKRLGVGAAHEISLPLTVLWARSGDPRRSEI